MIVAHLSKPVEVRYVGPSGMKTYARHCMLRVNKNTNTRIKASSYMRPIPIGPLHQCSAIVVIMYRFVPDRAGRRRPDDAHDILYVCHRDSLIITLHQ